ncbi:MBL fold metallo-hydrolase RNA specificity domain-containing protein [Methylobacterium trifolii]|uniref:Zn-dependent metallo-hydrolase RNA specificity domain-containing protein n=1 Tax=Methylobacterium trifolii TaxID=1003092 RepID=A0ABQ4U3D2_9HYPH|nr:MBL fold metallo-hydrolase RNA specificity domain-containing protein [Methylobacterium trifolii]GJE60862.1 hypothetical protein MPOCJGCO_2981 [Methylobacterium trifolii]
MLADIDALSPKVCTNARVIWSQWDGYLLGDSGAKLKGDLAERRIGLDVIHTSGHASIDELRRLVDALQPRALVLVHTFAGDRFGGHFRPSVTRRADGEWWNV